jgi:hypothetical protein
MWLARTVNMNWHSLMRLGRFFDVKESGDTKGSLCALRYVLLVGIPSDSFRTAWRQAGVLKSQASRRCLKIRQLSGSNSRRRLTWAERSCNSELAKRRTAILAQPLKSAEILLCLRPIGLQADVENSGLAAGSDRFVKLPDPRFRNHFDFLARWAVLFAITSSQ